MTRRCNAFCSFCQAPNTSRAELSVDSLTTISGILRRNGVRSLKLSGGEPTVRPDLPELIEATGHVVKVVIVSNGIDLHPEAVSAAASVGAEFKFSIHRPDASNDKVFGRPSFDNVLHSMAACRHAGVRFAIHTVVTTATVGLMRPMVGFAIEQEARKISFIPVVPRGRAGKGREGTSITPNGLATVRATVTELAEEYRDRIAVKCVDFWDHDYWVIENDGVLWIERSREGLDERVCDLPELLVL